MFSERNAIAWNVDADAGLGSTLFRQYAAYHACIFLQYVTASKSIVSRARFLYDDDRMQILASW